MSAKNEQEALKCLLREADEGSVARRQRRIRTETIVNRICASIIVLAIVGTGLVKLEWHDIMLLIGAFALGFSVAWDVLRNAHSRDMDFVEKYLDRGMIERRLQVLSSTSGD